MADELNSTQSTLHEGSLRAAGYSYLVGDAALFASGIMSGRTAEAFTGAMYGLGGVVLARYGKENAERRLQTLEGRLKKHFLEEHITIPQGSELTAAKLASEGGVIDRIEDFMYKYPSQILNAMYAVGGLAMIRSGMKSSKGWDTASGALVAAGGLAGLLIPEKHTEPGHHSHNPFERAWEWVQEKPLRAAGYLYMGNNATLIASALSERKANPAQKSYIFKLATAASYILANGLLSISSKDSVSHSGAEKNKDAMEKLEAAAAQVIAAQPSELQAQVIAQTAGYLAAQPEIKQSATQIAAHITQRVNACSCTQEKTWQARVQQPSALPSII